MKLKVKPLRRDPKERELNLRIDEALFPIGVLSLGGQRLSICPSCGRRHLLDDGVILVQCECGFVAIPEVSEMSPAASFPLHRNIAIRPKAKAA